MEGLFPEETVRPARRAGAGDDDAADLAELGAQRPAPWRPVARVALDTRVPHLDRLFDYLVPEHLHEQAQPGTRVRVVFNHREQAAWLIERTEDSEVQRRELAVVREVISPLPVLTPEVWELVQAVAARSAGLNSDVLRLAVPPRAATVERAWLQDGRVGAGVGKTEEAEKSAEPTENAEPAEPAKTTETATPAESAEAAGSADGPGTPQNPDRSTPTGAWALIPEGARLLERLERPVTAEDAARAVVSLPPGADQDWAEAIAQACAAAARGGRRSLVVVADQRRLDHLQTVLGRRVDAERIARLTHEDGASARYTGFLQALSGEAQVVIGTRSAAFAPLPDLGLIICFDDGDQNLIERQAPYFHARDALLLRAAAQGADLLLCGHTVTAEGLRLVATGWAEELRPDRAALRRAAPLIRSSTDSLQMARDPLAAVARIPALAYETARDGLKRGPVLVQVARTGYVPTLACQRCRAPARCTHCHGPLGIQRGDDHAARCRWCHQWAADWRCSECGAQQWRVSTAGALRTAEELGKAFPQVPVINSSADAVRAEVKPVPSLVVATPGAEPRVEGGYAAAILLDGERLLMRDALRTGEEVLRLWTNAAALVASRSRGGEVVSTGAGSAAEAALIRWDPLGFLQREMAERSQLGLPPAVRSMSLTGQQKAVEAFLLALNLEEDQGEGAVTVIDPVPVSEEDEEDEFRAILFFSYAVAPRITGQARAVRASFSAARRFPAVRVRCDAVDLL